MTSTQHGTADVPSRRGARVGSHEADAFDRSKAGPRARRVGSRQAGSLDRSKTKNAVQHHDGIPDEREREFLAEGFGDHLRSLRLDAGLTQAQLAAKVKCTRETVSLLETGRRRPEAGMVRRLLRHLVPPERRRFERKQLNRMADTSWREWERKTCRQQVVTRADMAEWDARERAKLKRLQAQLKRRTV